MLGCVKTLLQRDGEKARQDGLPATATAVLSPPMSFEDEHTRSNGPTNT